MQKFSYPTINQPWVNDAMCWKIPDPETWWLLDVPPEVRRVCINCPVRTDCLQYAIDHNERFGIWGGLSEDERASLKDTGHDAIQFFRRDN